MHDPLMFKRRLAGRVFAARVFGLAGAASLVSVYTACAGDAAKPAGASSSSASSGSSSGSITTSLHDAGHGGSSASASTSGAGGSTGGAGGMGGAPPALSCFAWPFDGGVHTVQDGSADGSSLGGSAPFDASIDGGTAISPDDAGPMPCPTDHAVVLQDFLDLQCAIGWEPYKIVSGPTADSNAAQCCYEVYNVLCGPGGRPFLVAGTPLRAPITSVASVVGSGWCGPAVAPIADAGLTETDRASLLDAWKDDAAMEHASVASFSRFALGLLAVGAPRELVALAHRAALDEIDHARACFALASRFAREDVAPGCFPLGPVVQVEHDLASLAASTLREGCFGETIAAVLASERLARATDPAAREALARIAEDEARHAELAWRTIAWAVTAGGETVRAALAVALDEALAGPLLATGSTVGSQALEARGVIDARTASALAAEVIDEIVAPAARALLAEPRARVRAEVVLAS